MTKLRLLLTAAVAVLILPAATAAAQGATVSTPVDKQFAKDGPSGRFLVDGTWLFRADPQELGLKQGFQTSASTAGWSPVTVPNAWNAHDQSPESMAGSVGWYRKDFRLPDTRQGLAWIVRFESVNYRSKVWLNGRPLGTNRGAYLPFEFRLPASALKRTGVNHLVIRIDNRRRPTDFPPSGLSTTGVPTGGWWNYGGILREVYLRRVDRIDFSTVQILPELPCSTCAATIAYRVTVRNDGGGAQRIHLTGRFGSQRIDLGSGTVGAGRFATFTKRLRVAHPRLWSPDSPSLYDATVDVSAGGKRVAHWYTASGIRSIKVVNGHLLLNGRPLNFRGVGVHEDSPDNGMAISSAQRLAMIKSVKELGATVIRSHYPLHPELQELADRYGIMLWSEIPVYSIKTRYLKQLLVRQLAAKELSQNILINGNHPSIIVWSIGNELSSRPGPVQGDYIRRAATAAHQLDPTRPVGLAVAGYPAAGCQPEYAPLDVIGINEYFGWYPGPNGQIADRTLLPQYLDGVHQCYPDKGLVITETGAEANRSGPVEEKGTFEFQQDFINYHFGVYATKPWLSGAIWWTLQAFRVRPSWDGGNPHPDPPIHEKAIIGFDGTKKPGYADLQRIYKATKQLGR
jgi:Glycosyl hydrolases family 2, TIM barrel domain/Glycosyl hydrolases family 2, sugar binding domain/Glycosyl hydrolases family 2